MMDGKNKIIIIGLDGVPHRLILDLASTGAMLHMKKLISEGELRQMESSIPEVSSVVQNV